MGIPPRYDDWADFGQRIKFMSRRKVIQDYTYLWYDVRPHPNFGTVEVRVMDTQTRVEHTLGARGAGPGDGQGAGEHYEAGKKLSRYPYEMLDENKWLAARHGLERRAGGPAEAGPRARPPSSRAGCWSGCAPHAEELGALEDLRVRGGHPRERATGRRASSVVYEANHDLHEVMVRR